MAKALTLAFVAPLVTTALSPILLGEKVGIRRWTAVIVGFIGSLVVIRPGFIEFNLATIAALGTGCLYGVYLIITRKLHTTDNPLLTLLLTGIVGAHYIFILCTYSLGKSYKRTVVMAFYNGYFCMFRTYIINLFFKIC